MKLSRLSLFIILAAVLSFPAAGAAASGQNLPAIIPLPLEMKPAEGQFKLDQQTAIYFDSALSQEAQYLADKLKTPTGFTPALKPLPSAPADQLPKNAIILAVDRSRSLGDEGYTLKTGPEGVVIKAENAAGAFYGIQTLIQLFPPEILSDKKRAEADWTVPGIEVRDRPRFLWRAYLLDDARWFHGIQTAKRMLDQLALHKMNVFHWHLTDDQGWRIEIKRYPRLTEVGSKRKDTQLGTWDSKQRSGKPHEGFYTQEEIKEIVRYAAERHITIVPEIEMPGHATAAIAAYPEVGTSGRPVEVAITFGRKYDIFNVADEKVYTFLENILEEVMALFPSRVIHLGGDEVYFDQWLASTQVKDMMERMKFSDPRQVQLYFTNRMSRFLESKGRRMMGWNEILGDDLDRAARGGKAAPQSEIGQLARNAIIHFWRGSLELAERAAREGHDIVNSLHSSTYLDYTYEDIPLARAYDFEPIPAGLAGQYHPHVLGLGCQMWSEWTPTRERIEFQTFPRLSAYAEIGWTAKERKNYQDFLERMKTQRKRWDIQGIGYAPEGFGK